MALALILSLLLSKHPEESIPDLLALLLPGFNYSGPLFFSLPSALGQEIDLDKANRRVAGRVISAKNEEVE